MRFLVLAAALLPVAPALAQEAVSDSACTYAECALQIERTPMGVRLVRGGVPVPVPPVELNVVGRVAGALGMPPTGPLPIVEAVASSPAALAHARDWRRAGGLAADLRAGAYATFLVTMALSPFDVLSDDVQRGVLVGAAGLFAVSFPLDGRSRRSRGRAIEA